MAFERESPWFATITRRGRWVWNVSIQCGSLDPGWNYVAWSKEHAERKARRLLARRERARERSRESVTIRLGDGE